MTNKYLWVWIFLPMYLPVAYFTATSEKLPVPTLVHVIATLFLYWVAIIVAQRITRKD